MNGNILAERRILATKWVANSWAYIIEIKHIVTRGFKKCGINVALDSSEDHLVNIEGIPGYKFPSGRNADAEYALVDDSSDSDDSNDDNDDPPAGDTDND